MPKLLKVVFDTNILVSSLWRGTPWNVVKRWRDGHIHLIVSPAVLREYLDVLGRFVSGDRHLIALSSFRSIPILTPAAFLKRFPP